MTLLPEGKLYIDGQLRDATGGGKFEEPKAPAAAASAAQ